MPKGALLHAHMDAMYVVEGPCVTPPPDPYSHLSCDADFLYQRALSEPRMHVRVTEKLTKESWPFDPQPQFAALPNDSDSQSDGVTNLCDPSYPLGAWVLLQDARRTFSGGLYGGAAGFDRWVVSSMRINPEEAYVKYNTSKKVCLSGTHIHVSQHTSQIWKKFASTFGVARVRSGCGVSFYLLIVAF